MVARLLRAELSGESPGIEERPETHEDDALDLGQNVSEMMRDQHQACAFQRELRETLRRLAQEGKNLLFAVGELLSDLRR